MRHAKLPRNVTRPQGYRNTDASRSRRPKRRNWWPLIPLLLILGFWSGFFYLIF